MRLKRPAADGFWTVAAESEFAVFIEVARCVPLPHWRHMPKHHGIRSPPRLAGTARWGLNYRDRLGPNTGSFVATTTVRRPSIAFAMGALVNPFGFSTLADRGSATSFVRSHRTPL